MDMYVLLQTLSIERPCAGRRNPDAMSTLGQIGSQRVRHGRHTANHGRILIGDE